MKNNSPSDTREIIIKPKTGWQLINWNEIKEYKDLIYFLILRDVKALYKQTILYSMCIKKRSMKLGIFHLST